MLAVGQLIKPQLCRFHSLSDANGIISSYAVCGMMTEWMVSIYLASGSI